MVLILACARSIHPSWVHRDCPHAGAALDLIATVSHHGRTLASGHYTADVRQVCSRLPSLRGCCGARKITLPALARLGLHLRFLCIAAVGEQ